jgi:hypothetical protein
MSGEYLDLVASQVLASCERRPAAERRSRPVERAQHTTRVPADEHARRDVAGDDAARSRRSHNPIHHAVEVHIKIVADAEVEALVATASHDARRRARHRAAAAVLLRGILAA